MFWDASKCRKAKYCAFNVIQDDAGATLEQCSQCGRKVVYRKVNGRIDNRKYLSEHVRDFAQRHGPTSKIFEQIYGKTAIKNLDEEAKRLGLRNYSKSARGLSEKQQQGLDFFRTLGKTSV